MRLLSTFFLLSILAFVGACSKSNYAQVEPDDLYFSRNDRKAAQTYYSSSADATSTVADASYNNSNADVSTYTNQHSPVLYSKALGSPTIQLDEQAFYNASQNPDYLSGQEVEYEEGVSDAYYIEDYAGNNVVTTAEEPQIVNNYYGTGYSPYNSGGYYGRGYPYSSMYYSPFSFSLSYTYGYSPFRSYRYRPFGYSSYYYGSPYYSYYDPYGYYYPFNSNYYYSNSGYYSNSYCYYPSNYGSVYNTTNDGVNNNSVTTVTGPRRSRSSVSYYANKQNYDIKRRDSYIAGSQDGEGNEGGRVLADESRSRYTPTGNSSPTSVNRRNSNRDNSVNRRGSVTPASGTIQRSNNSNSRYSSNTVRRTMGNTRNGSSVTSNYTNKGATKTYVNRSSNRQSNNVSRSSNRQSVNNNSNRTTRTRYSSPSRSNSSYNRSGSNSSYRAPRSNSSSRSSYSPRSNSGSSRSSVTPSRSSSSRSSVTKSSSGRTRSTSVKRKN